jgi:hypothetical protein
MLCWTGLLLLYVCLISTTTQVELEVGAAASAVVTAIAVVAVHAFDVRLAVPRFRWRWLATFPFDAGMDVFRLGGHVLDSSRKGGDDHGWWDELELLDSADPPDAVRAYAVLIVSLTPASYVADVSVEDSDGSSDGPGVLYVRRWAPAGPVERVVSG